MGKNWFQFLQDDSGSNSISRLVLLGTFIVASLIMVWLSYTGNMSEGYFTIYVAYPTTAYAISKQQDTKALIATPPPQ